MNKSPENILSDMIKEGKIPKKAICTASGMSCEEIENYLSGDFEKISDKDICYLNGLSMLLGYGLKSADEDERLKAITESLITIYGFTVKQLSDMTGAKTETIQNVLDGKEVDVNEKYSLSVSLSYLCYVLKRPSEREDNHDF